MKPILTCIAASSLAAVLAMAQPAPPIPHYTVTDLGTLGGTYSNAFGISNLGEVAGAAATPAQTNGVASTAFLWYAGRKVDLGTLDGPACPKCSSAAGAANMFGEVLIGSETANGDPNGEDFCYYGTHRQCVAATWNNGRMRVLPMLPGGNNAQGYWLNNLGQTIGFSENGIHDAGCVQATPFQVLRFEAVIWGPNGDIRELPPLDGDTVAFGFGINDLGQAVGGSGTCDNTSPPSQPNAPHAVLWDSDGSAHDLGSLGGPLSIASSINNRGQVAGASLSSTDGNVHAFVWTKQNGLQDLGLLGTDTTTVAPCCNTINNSGQVVGFSCPGPQGSCRAFLWQNNVMTDLNTLIPAGSPWYLQAAQSINDLGQIVGYGLIGGEIHAFLATPH